MHGQVQAFATGLFVYILSIFGSSTSGQSNTLRIVFAGDIMGHDSQIAAARIDTSDQYDYTGCFRHIKPFLEDADIAVGNLEVTHAGKPYKGYPQFSSPDELTDALLESGFNVMINANNHALDRGKAGFERTQQVLRQKGMILTGTFTSPDARELSYPLILEKKGIRMALLNYTYGTNGLVADTPNVINYIDTLLIRHDIQKARMVEPDIIIACIHWGKEYEREKNPVQQALGDFLFNQGVDAVIGSHPHVVQPVEYKQRGNYYYQPIVYSLGNFISNQRNRYRNGGIIFGLEIEKTDKTRISGMDYLPVYVHKPKSGDKYSFELIPSGIPDEMMEEYNFTDQDKIQYLEFCEDTRQHLSNIHHNHFFQK
jgi:poly-gamma-glutamate synthesis protein (capsule biosynthesis protein)